MTQLLEYNGMTIPENTYAITETGEIWSLSRTISKGKRGERKLPLKKMRPKLGTDGYYQVQLQVDGTTKWVRLHRLIASTFLDGFFDGNHVNHIDGNKLNNNVDNLEWCTNEENIKHAYRTGLMDNCKKTQFKKGHVPWNKVK